MTPDQEPVPTSTAPEQSAGSPPDRRGRRSGRGRRGRGRGRPQAAREPLPPLAEEAADPAQPAAEPAPVEVEAPAPLPPRERRPASPAAVQQAIDDVTSIIETLRSTLANMEEVLETVELAERQKAADEQEIESLLRKLNQLGRPREGGHHPPRR